MHLIYFTPSSLRCALHSAGFRVAHIETTDNFGFWPTMRAEVLETFTKAYPEYTDPDKDKRIQKVKDEMKLFEVFCLAQRLYEALALNCFQHPQPHAASELYVGCTSQQ